MKLSAVQRLASITMKPASLPLVAVVLASAMLAGCGGDNSDLEQWMAQTFG